MTPVGQREALTQKRVLEFFRDALSYTYLGHWKGREGNSNVEEVLYEGYGPSGVAIMCDIMTDNRNRTAPEIRKLFDEHGVTWAPYRTVRETVEHDSDLSDDNPMFQMVEQPEIGTYLMPGSPLAFGALERDAVGRAPKLGEHTDEILLDVLGLSETEVGNLHDAKIVAGPDESAFSHPID